MTITYPPPKLLDPARRAIELRGKLASLGAELASWRAATSSVAGPLPRHHTQVDSVTGTLEQACGAVRAELMDAGDSLTILDRTAYQERRILDIYRLWGFFRDKLALRFVPWVATSLSAADDLAWTCYGPAQRFIAAERRREPPLVYFTGGASPFLMPRESLYVVEPLPDGGLRAPQFAEIVRALPVALIGLPWSLADHLPDAPLIAHEVGHAIEFDLGLAEKVRALIEAAVPAQRREAWGAWSSEVFADLFGVLSCGSGYSRALAALLTAHPRRVAGDERTGSDWGTYPTATARVLLCAAALEHLQVVPVDLAGRGGVVRDLHAAHAGGVRSGRRCCRRGGPGRPVPGTGRRRSDRGAALHTGRRGPGLGRRR